MACCGWPASRALPDILMVRPRDMMKAAKMTGAEGKLTRAGNSKFIRSPNLGILLCICWPPSWGSREFQRLPCPRLVYLTLPQAATRVGKCTPWLAPAPLGISDTGRHWEGQQEWKGCQSGFQRPLPVLQAELVACERCACRTWAGKQWFTAVFPCFCSYAKHSSQRSRCGCGRRPAVPICATESRVARRVGLWKAQVGRHRTCRPGVGPGASSSTLPSSTITPPP